MADRRASVVSRVEGTDDPTVSDPQLLANNSELKSYKTSRFTYPSIRVFYRPHPQGDELPRSPAPLPLLVFVHGLGGSVAQFHPLLTSLTNNAGCLAVDLPGCGRSTFAPSSWDAYTTDALAELLETVIEDYVDKAAGQGVVLIGHSMGTSLAARLACRTAPHTTDLADRVKGLVAICPSAGPPPEDKVALFKKLLWIPTPVFDLWRAWDRRGGVDSPSVQRFLGPNADIMAKRLQNRYNNQSRTPVWRRMAWGALPTYENGVPKGGLPGKEVWAELNIPVFLVGGADDHITPPTEIPKIIEFLGQGEAVTDAQNEDHPSIVDSAAPVDTNIESRPAESSRTIEDISEEDFKRDRRLVNQEESFDDPSTPAERPDAIPPQPTHPKKVVKSIILPSPATHALLYAPSTARIVAGLVSDFMQHHISGRLELGWQLQYLSKEGKWDVKNLEKWKKVAEVSEPIGGVFRAMKTLREVDDSHSPREFVQKWHGVIKDVIDISHDNPVYDPRALEQGGVKYHKFPTVSKIPPSDEEVEHFVQLVDQIREEQKQRAKDEGWPDEYYVAVHCHYGFNRTGYFVVCYLVDRCKYKVADAIEAFAKSRPNGIRHSHFLDQLYVRYSGLKHEDD